MEGGELPTGREMAEAPGACSAVTSKSCVWSSSWSRLLSSWSHVQWQGEVAKGHWFFCLLVLVLQLLRRAPGGKAQRGLCPLALLPAPSPGLPGPHSPQARLGRGSVGTRLGAGGARPRARAAQRREQPLCGAQAAAAPAAALGRATAAGPQAHLHQECQRRQIPARLSPDGQAEQVRGDAGTQGAQAMAHLPGRGKKAPRL